MPCWRTLLKSPAISALKNTTASPYIMPFFVPPKESRSTPQPSVTSCKVNPDKRLHWTTERHRRVQASHCYEQNR